MATTETPIAIAATATEAVAVAQQDATVIAPADKAVDASPVVTVEPPSDATVATDKASEETSAAEPAKTSAEADAKPTEEVAEVAAPSTDKDAAVQEEKKPGFLTSLRKGLNVALVPKPSLDNASEGKTKKEEAKQAETATATAASETPAEGAVEGADAPPSECAPAAIAKESPAPPVRRTSFAAFKHRVSHGFATPIASPSATPTRKGTTGTVANLTASPPASPGKSTSSKLHELAESAATKLEETATHLKHNIETVASKIKEDSPKAEDRAPKAPGTAHKKVDQFKGKAEALGKKFEEAFHKKSSASKPAAAEPEVAATQEPAEAVPAVAVSADAEATDEAAETAAGENAEAPTTAASKVDGEASQPAKPEKKFLGLKKRFSISVQSKGGDKSAATSGDEEKDAAVVTKGASPAEPVAETAANDATPSGSETVVVQDAAKETPPVAQRKPSIFSAFVNGKGSSKTATSPSAVPKADPLEAAVEAPVTQEVEAEAAPAETAAPATPEAAAKETESVPASPAKGSGKKGMAPSSFGLEKLNKMANKILDKGKDSKKRLSAEFHRAKKDKEAEAGQVTPTEQVEDKTEAPVAAAAEAPVAAPALDLEAIAAPVAIVESEAAKPAETKVEDKVEEKVEEPVAAAAAPAAAAEVKVDAEEKKE